MDYTALCEEEASLNSVEPNSTVLPLAAAAKFNISSFYPYTIMDHTALQVNYNVKRFCECFISMQK